MPSQTVSYTELLSALLDSARSPAEHERLFQSLVAMPLTAPLLTACVRALRERMISVQLSGTPIDTCGTGGSGKYTINTSTLVAFIVAAAGGTVAKHGNRAASGTCGSFDVLEQLGVCINLRPDNEKKLFEELGIVFLFAPAHHPALRHLAPLRKQYGNKTVFNLAGPLCNPAGVTKQIIGTGSKQDAILLAETLRQLSNIGSMVVRGNDGLDEITTTTSSTIYSVTPDGIKISECNPHDFGIAVSDEQTIAGGDKKTNSRIFLEVLQGTCSIAHRNIVVMNAAYALLLAGLAHTPHEGIRRADEMLASGAALTLFNAYKSLSQEMV